MLLFIISVSKRKPFVRCPVQQLFTSFIIAFYMVARNHIKVKISNKIMVAHNNTGRQLMNNVNHALVLRIQELLEEKQMTRYKLAMESGVSHSTLKNIIHETVKDNLLSTTILIAGGFGMTVSQFLDSPLFNEENLNI